MFSIKNRYTIYLWNITELSMKILIRLSKHFLSLSITGNSTRAPKQARRFGIKRLPRMIYNSWAYCIGRSLVVTNFAQKYIPPGLTSIHRKCLSYNSIQQKSLSYQSIHQVYRENVCHKIFIHFWKTIEKKLNHFCGFLRTVEQTGDKKNGFKIIFFLKKMLSIL